jgi:hypothetical protein
LHLYRGTTEQFIADAVQSRLATQLSDRFLEEFRYKPAPPEGVTDQLVTDFRWPWSDPDAAGNLIDDVRVGEWSMPWNAKAESTRLGPGIPKSDFWASAKEGIDQVGCVYTAQGFEFDYVGVICGRDLVYRPIDGGWIGQGHESRDRIVSRGVTDAEFTAFLNSTYRVLLTRGLSGCYVYFVDAATRDFFLSWTEVRRMAGAAEERSTYAP